MFPGYVFRFLLFSHLTVLLLAAGNGKGNHDECPDSFDCGNLGRIRFPFTKVERPDCGTLPIQGCDDHNPNAVKHVQLKNGGRWFEVREVDNGCHDSISIIDEDLRKLLQSGNCCKAFSYNVTLPPRSPLGCFHIKHNITLFKCNSTLKVTPPTNFVKTTSCPPYDIIFGPPNSADESLRSLAACSMVQLPMNMNGFPFYGSGNPFAFLTSEISLRFLPSYYCIQCSHDGGGHCRLDRKRKFYCAKSKDRSSVWKLGLVLGVGFGPWIMFGFNLILMLWHCKRKYALAHVQLQSRDNYTDAYPNSDGETYRVFFGVPVFSYKELQEATNNFDRTRKLGDGGFGTVYFGKLVDGREVAVKHLFEHNYKRVEQFMNEIEILTRLRHRNLVSLYGCTSRHSRELLLVYEYIPNGTVASHLHGDLARAGLLSWPIRVQIAIETATALAYLHASDIIHREMKTNNIPLVINFSVKVADFGLSRLFPNDVSHVSTAPQGSPGYLDPEYNQCYQLTSKSDVYSFGVVLLELISSFPALDIGRPRDEINLANLATKKIRNDAFSELVDPSLGFESDNEVRRMMTSMAELAFQCVQGDKELRPSMDEVLKALKKTESGNIYEPEHLEKGNNGAGISQSEVHPAPTASQDSGQVGFLMNIKLPSSPNSVTDKWESGYTTPNASG